MVKDTLLIVDTDDGFADRFGERLRLLGLTDRYSVERISPNTKLPDEQMVSDCADRVVRRFSESPNFAAVFVDIVVYEGNDLDLYGLGIATEVASRLPAVPIYSITGKGSSRTDQDLVSLASLETDTVLLKSYLDSDELDIDRLEHVIQCGRAKLALRSTMTAPVTAVSGMDASSTSSFGSNSLPFSVRAEIDEVGRSSFWNLLSAGLKDGEGTLSLLRKGRSGASVFLARASFKEGRHRTSPTSWVLKVSRDQQALQAEIDAYHKLLNRPRLDGTPRLKTPHVLWDGHLAMIISEFAGERVPLREGYSKLSKTASKTFAKNLLRNLSTLYGSSEPRIVKVWKESLAIDSTMRVRLNSWLDEHNGLFQGLAKHRDASTLREFLAEAGAAWRTVEVYEESGGADYRTVHGDLNAGNVLIDFNGAVTLIDFPSLKSQPVAVDITKLERDVICRLMFRDTLLFHDWKLLGAARPYLKLLQGQSVRSSEPRVQEALRFVTILRQRWTEDLRTPIGDTYLLALLRNWIAAILNEEFSTQMRVFAVSVAATILRHFESAPKVGLSPRR